MITCQFENGGKTSLRHAVVHTIVEQEGNLLLGKRTGNLLESGKWGLIGGYMERDETASECALRELKEEAGWLGEIITLFRVNTNPHRPHEDRQNITIEFIVRPLEKVSQPDKENSKIAWIPIRDLWEPSLFAFDHGETIALYCKWRKEQYRLPLFI